jgi:HSP20 family molecular chaperone IbpA
MALIHWKDFENFFANHDFLPWHHHQEVAPYIQPQYRVVPFGLSRPFRDLEKMQGELADAVPTIGKEGFQVSLNVKQFTPNEITVKTSDNSILIEGKHEERPDENGYVSRQFMRRYPLPPNYEAEKVTSELSSDGVLTIKAPLPKALEDKSNERVVNITQTGPAHLNVKENKPIEEPKDKPAEAEK